MRKLFAILASVAFFASCGREAADKSQDAPSGDSEKTRTVLVMGDSLTAGYQLPPESSYPSQLERMLRENGYAYSVSNAWVSWDTSAGLLERTDWLLSDPLPDLAILCIGANDGLQWLPVSQMETSVRAILSKLKEKNVKTVLVGIKIPRNLWLEYVAEFEATYPKLAREFDVPFLPFLLEWVAKVPSLNLEDGMHPNAEGYAIVAKNVFDFLEEEEIVTK